MSIKSLLPLSVLATSAYAQLNQLAVAKGLTYFGSATDNSELTDTAYTAILSNTTEFGQITPGNSMKWDATEPEQNTFTFTNGDVIADLAANNSQYLRCHNLVWYSQLPSWVTSGTWTNETLTAAMKNHITTEVTHYKGQCLQWDVVNEALNDDGTYRENIFYTTIGETYIDIAFQTAYAADSSAKLYYNDYNTEYGGAKSTAALALVKRLLAADVPIHGVGFQGHFEVGDTPDATDLASNLAEYTALGVEVAYTEVDVRFTSLPPTDAGLAQQSTDYASVATACLNTEGCVGITVWDFDDAYSWVPSTFSGQGDADLFNSSLVRKPAYYGVVAALSSASDVAASSTASATASSAISSSVVVSSAISTSAVSSVVTTSAASSSAVSTSAAISTSSSLSVAVSSTVAATSTTASVSSTFVTAVASAAPTSSDEDVCEE